MKLIEVLQKVANGEIEKGTKLWLEECSFNFNGDSFTNEQYPFGNSSFLSTRFLNKEVEFIPPKEKKYRLKLYKEDDLSYVTRSPYVNIFSYCVSDKNETRDFITKFTQEEIDNDVLLKFIEQHGVKEEVKENEND